MTYIGPDDVFDIDKFYDDIKAYADRKKLTYTNLADVCIVDRSWLSKNIRDRNNLSLRMACLLAEACDLNLHSYIKVSIRA